MIIDEKTQNPTPGASGVDPGLSDHLKLPQYVGSVLGFAVQGAYRTFLQDLEDINGGKEIPVDIAAAAWARLVGQRFKEMDVGSVHEAGKGVLLAKIMRQVSSCFLDIAKPISMEGTVGW